MKVLNFTSCSNDTPRVSILVIKVQYINGGNCATINSANTYTLDISDITGNVYIGLYNRQSISGGYTISNITFSKQFYL